MRLHDINNIYFVSKLTDINSKACYNVVSPQYLYIFILKDTIRGRKKAPTYEEDI